MEPHRRELAWDCGTQSILQVTTVCKQLYLLVNGGQVGEHFLVLANSELCRLRPTAGFCKGAQLWHLLYIDPRFVPNVAWVSHSPRPVSWQYDVRLQGAADPTFQERVRTSLHTESQHVSLAGSFCVCGKKTQPCLSECSVTAAPPTSQSGTALIYLRKNQPGEAPPPPPT